MLRGMAEVCQRTRGAPITRKTGFEFAPYSLSHEEPLKMWEPGNDFAKVWCRSLS